MAKTDVDLNPLYRDQKQIFIYILNVFSIFYSYLSQKCKDKEKTEAYLTSSTSFVNQAEKISIYDPMTMICKGFLFFAQGDYDNSEIYFSNITDNDKHPNLSKYITILAKIGKAFNSYNKGNYSKAVEHIVSLIREYDYVNENMLESLGICYYNTGKIKKSREIFEKVLELNPGNIKVLTYLHIVDLESSNLDEERLVKALEILTSTYIKGENENFHLLLVRLGNLLLAAGRVKEAEEVYLQLNTLLDNGEMRTSKTESNNQNKDKYRRDNDDVKSNILCMNAKIHHYKVKQENNFRKTIQKH